MNHKWRDLGFWQWWWRERVSYETKAGVLVGLFALLLIGGYFGASSINSVAASPEDEVYVRTVERQITVRRGGEVVTKPVRVVRVRTVTGGGGAAAVTQTQTLRKTVTSPGSTVVVTERDVETVPVIRRLVETRDGRVATVIQVRGVTSIRTSVVADRRTVTSERVLTRTSVVTDLRTVTSERVLTSERVVTRERVVTQPVTTTRVVTETVPLTLRSTETIRSTETVPVTVVQTQPITVVQTLPVTVTVTVKK